MNLISHYLSQGISLNLTARNRCMYTYHILTYSRMYLDTLLRFHEMSPCNSMKARRI
jgi:hypothetical protein